MQLDIVTNMDQKKARVSTIIPRKIKFKAKKIKNK